MALENEMRRGPRGRLVKLALSPFHQKLQDAIHHNKKSPSDLISDLRHKTFPDGPSSWRQGWRRQFLNTGVVI